MVNKFFKRTMSISNVYCLGSKRILLAYYTRHNSISLLPLHLNEYYFILKSGPLRLKQHTNTLKIRILSENSIPYLIRYASIILIVGLRL